MKFFAFFLFLFLTLNSFIFSSSLKYVATGGIWTVACVEFCFSPAPDDTSYTRGKGLCLWANLELSHEDVGKVFYQKIKNSGGEVIYQKLLKIIEDDFCLSSDYPSGFPNGYALYYYSPENKKYLFAYCLANAKNPDGSYDFKRPFAPAGCGMTDCSTKLGHYTYEFYEEENFKGSATFWMVPDFNGYYDRFQFSKKGDNIPASCHRMRMVNTESVFYGEFMCSDWEGADFKFDSKGTYSTYLSSNFTPHSLHYTSSFEFQIQDSEPKCNDIFSSFGRIETTEGKYIVEENNHMPHFKSKWKKGSLSGI